MRPSVVTVRLECRLILDQKENGLGWLAKLRLSPIRIVLFFIPPPPRTGDMRRIGSLLALFVLTGCPSATPPVPPEPSPTLEVAVEVEPKALPTNFEGVWTTTDTQGRNFDIVVFPNGQVVTNRNVHARGERGFWRLEGNRFLGVFEDGWTHSLEALADQTLYQGTDPGGSLRTDPDGGTLATRVDEAKAPFVGIWRMNKEPDGSYLYLALQSNGQALSTINGGTEGLWELTQQGALCTWPDGWVDLIERIPGGWQKRSWVGVESDAPADLSKATRVGEARFEIIP